MSTIKDKYLQEPKSHSDYPQIANDVLSISFAVTGRVFKPPPLKSVHVLHYKFTSDVGFNDGGDDAMKEDRIVANQPYAELIVRCKRAEFSTDDSAGPEYTMQSEHSLNKNKSRLKDVSTS